MAHANKISGRSPIVRIAIFLTAHSIHRPVRVGRVLFNRHLAWNGGLKRTRPTQLTNLMRFASNFYQPFLNKLNRAECESDRNDDDREKYRESKRYGAAGANVPIAIDASNPFEPPVIGYQIDLKHDVQKPYDNAKDDVNSIATKY